jgi:hypothetical protein
LHLNSSISSPISVPNAKAIDNCGGVGWRLSTEELATLDKLAVNQLGMYDDPEAIYSFTGWWPNPIVRPLVSGVIWAGLGAAKWLVPLQESKL